MSELDTLVPFCFSINDNLHKKPFIAEKVIRDKYTKYFFTKEGNETEYSFRM